MTRTPRGTVLKLPIVCKHRMGRTDAIITIIKGQRVIDMGEVEHRRLVIIGGGPAGLTAAIYGRRAGLDVLVLEKGIYGGQINGTAEIENWPGTRITEGIELGRSFHEHAEALGAEFRDCRVESLSFEGNEKTIVTNKGEIAAEAIVIATGATFSRAGCKGEDEFAGRGVSYCAVCDGAFFEDLPVAVIGGGNTAVEEAGYLTQFASKVYVIHRREEFRADKAAVERALANPKIEPVLGYVVDEIFGKDMVEGVRLRNLANGKARELPVEGVFVFVGIKPTSGFINDRIEKENGWIITNEQMETSVEGVFAAGDVRKKFLRQVVTAAADGAIAAMSAYEYISSQLYLKSALVDPENVFALFISSIEPEHLALVKYVEERDNASGVRIVTIDGHRNLRIRQKMGIKTLPTIVELSYGRKMREAVVSAPADIETFCRK